MTATTFIDNAKVMAKGQVTIPKDIREILGVSNGDRITFVVENGNVFLGHRLFGPFAHDVIGGLLEVQLGAVAGVDHIALKPDHPAQPGGYANHQHGHQHGADPFQHSLGTIGNIHRVAP